jgi:myosin heavy subunit
MANVKEEVKVTKVTKTMKFDMLLDIEEVASNEMLVEFINHEKELIAKKSGSGIRKLTRTQIENKTLAEKIVTLLSEVSRPLTATEIKNNLENEVKFEKPLSVPRVSAQLKKLVESGKVKRTLEKGSPIFEIV